MYVAMYKLIELFKFFLGGYWSLKPLIKSLQKSVRWKSKETYMHCAFHIRIAWHGSQ